MWRFGDYGDFLGLSDAERQTAELRIRLSRGIRDTRERAEMTRADPRGKGMERFVDPVDG